MNVSLAWIGHEFSDSIRSEIIWNKVEKGIADWCLGLGSVSLGVLKDFADLKIRGYFGL